MPVTYSNGSARFSGRVALVVGGANGIGRAIAGRLAAEHADVVIADIDREGMEQTAREIQTHGSRIMCLPCDIRETCQVTAMVAKVIETFQKIDVLMQIAGIAAARPFLDLDDGTWDETM